MAQKKKSRISPIFKRAASHIFTKPATTKYPIRKTTASSRKPAAKQSMKSNHATSSTLEQASKMFHFRCKINCGLQLQSLVRDCPACAIEIVEVEGKRRPQIELQQMHFLPPMR